ncbi:LuxR family transcriptional regulator [Micromonospora echinofusca]|uniref:LuxR family transcriptional regulator n=1 Tax=Micromonospora echinofusca TaxID=47858 RepID=A0ABS3W266_MICEH|nr:LuxR family transcriptional regulator [Micromonospora echinofusca]MBO4210821.1 LuxR family transcriptional regulator [Micromonospora echinofusca]
MTVPRHVLPDLPAATTVLRALTRDGWHTREGFALLADTWDVSDTRLVLFGRVDDDDTVRLVVLAAARGAGVVAVVDPTSPRGRALRADLDRLTPGPTVPAVLPLRPEQVALLARLAAGETIAAAAAAEFLSLRTANRRIAAARAALGVRTTREAVLAYLHRRAG